MLLKTSQEFIVRNPCDPEKEKDGERVLLTSLNLKGIHLFEAIELVALMCKDGGCIVSPLSTEKNYSKKWFLVSMTPKQRA